MGSQRTRGYLKAHTEHELPIRNDLIISINDQYDMTEQITKLFSFKEPPDGIFAVNEIYAATSMKIAQKLGWIVPEKLAIIGFTDGFISEFTNPPLSTVAQHGFRMGLRSFELLLEEIEHQEEPYNHRFEKISTDLILRKSTIKE